MAGGIVGCADVGASGTVVGVVNVEDVGDVTADPAASLRSCCVHLLSW